MTFTTILSEYRGACEEGGAECGDQLKCLEHASPLGSLDARYPRRQDMA